MKNINKGIIGNINDIKIQASLFIPENDIILIHNNKITVFKDMVEGKKIFKIGRFVLYHIPNNNKHK